MSATPQSKMYSAAVAAFLNADTDRVLKQWCDVVNFFFIMNEDKRMAMLVEIATAFENARRPNVFRIDASDIELYLNPTKLTATELQARGYKNNLDFIEDGPRLTFPTLRGLIFASGTKRLIEGYELVDSMYRLYVRYEVAMASRIKISTHWTLVERVNEFTKPMQPHIDQSHSEKPKYLTMNAQPRVFTIVKGTSKALNDRFTKPHSKFSSKKVIPICESILPDGRDEIKAVLEYLKQRHEVPYRQSQVGQLDADGKQINSLLRTKCSIKTTKTMILIDPSQSVYTVDMLHDHIQDVRDMLRRGEIGCESRPTLNENTTNLKIFNQTKGRFMDTFLAIELHPTTEIPFTLRTPVAPFSLPQIVFAPFIEKDDTSDATSDTSDTSFCAEQVN